MHEFAMGFGWIVFFLFMLMLIYLFTPKNINTRSDKSAQDILDERYAKGEIEEDEYKKKSEDIRDHKLGVYYAQRYSLRYGRK